MVGFAVAEIYQGADKETAAELFSLKMLSDHLDQNIEITLVGHLRKLVGRPLAP